MAGTPNQEQLIALRRILSERFSDGELRNLCFDLGIDYESFPGNGKSDKARELVALSVRHHRIPELVAAIKDARPDLHEALPPTLLSAATLLTTRQRDTTEIARKRDLVYQHNRRLHVLELQAAQFGLHCPPHITLEIDDLNQKIAALEREIAASGG